MKVLVTGINGFIGSTFAKWLLTEDPDVQIVGFSRKSDMRNELRLAEVKDKIHMIYGDLTDESSLSGICEGIDVIIHFAAKTFVDHSIKDDLPFFASNVIGTRNLMKDAMRYNVKKTIIVSTDEVYGQILEGSYKEDSRLDPRNPYAATKAAADLLAVSYYHTYNFPVIITRTENNFGPWQHPQKAFPTFTRYALEGKPLPVYGDGLHIRCWLYVEDHCRAIWHLVKNGQVGEIYHIAGEKEMTNIDLAKRVLNILDKPEDMIEFIDDFNIRPGHDRRYSLDVSKLKATGWEPRYTLDERIEYTIKWYAEHKEFLR